MPWKNGEGSTCQLYKIPDPNDESLFLFRLSIATVSKSGSFSLFPGIERLIMILDGNGIKLDLPSGDITLTKNSKPLAFSGDAAVYAELLDGFVLDFNVMVARNFKKVNVEILANKKFQAISHSFILDFQNKSDYRLIELNAGDSVDFRSSGKQVLVYFGAEVD